MDKEAILKHTTSYEESLINHLQDPELAQAYLETALESCEQDGDTEALLLPMRHVVEVQGGIDELAKRTKISSEHLYDIFSSKHNLCLDDWLKIISGLGFRVRLEQQKSHSGHTLDYKR